jgi:TolB-like protein
VNRRSPNSNSISKNKLPPDVSKHDVYEQLEKVMNSSALCQAGRLRDFLKYVVSALLEENAEPIKEYRIGVEVFGRKPSFDPRLDPIVRVEASRLRARMKQYLETEGQNDWLVIQVPKGGYMPTVEISSAHRKCPSIIEPLASDAMSTCADYVDLALLPFLNLGAVPSTQLVCDSLTEELIDMLADVERFRVSPRVSVSQFKYQPDDARNIGKRLGVNFLLEGSVRHSEDLLHVKLRLIHAGTGFGRRLGSFERVVQDLVATQRDICKSIISTLKLHLLGESEVSYPPQDKLLLDL